MGGGLATCLATCRETWADLIVRRTCTIRYIQRRGGNEKYKYASARAPETRSRLLFRLNERKSRGATIKKRRGTTRKVGKRSSSARSKRPTESRNATYYK